MEAAGVAARPFLSTGRLLRALGDDRLVARIRAGDHRAFETVYDRHHRRLLAFCRHMLGNQEEAEDVLQHTFAAAYRSLCESDAEIQLKAWLYAIARNRCLSLLRVRREQVALDDVSPATEGLHRQVERRADLRELLGDLQSLPEDQRAALVLSELGAHSHDDIAMILEVRREKVKALVFQARESLATSRRARETPCHEVQEQLATLRGSALRRAPISRHVAACPGCTAFKAEVQRQRAALAIILPAAPSLALKSAVLAPVIGGSGIAAGLGAGAAVGHVASSAAGAGGGITALGHGLAAKAIATAAVVASVGGGGIAADRLRDRAAPDATPRERPAVSRATREVASPPAAARPQTRTSAVAPAPAPSAPARPAAGPVARGRDRPAKPRKHRRKNAAVQAAPTGVVPAAVQAPAYDDDDHDRDGDHRPYKRHKHDDDRAGGAEAPGRQVAAAPESAPAPTPQPSAGRAPASQSFAPGQERAAGEADEQPKPEHPKTDEPESEQPKGDQPRTERQRHRGGKRRRSTDDD